MNKCKLDHKEALDVVAYGISIRYADVSPLVVEEIVKNYLTVRSLVAVPEIPTREMLYVGFGGGLNLQDTLGRQKAYTRYSMMLTAAPGPYNRQMLEDAEARWREAKKDKVARLEAELRKLKDAEVQADCTELSEAQQ